MWLLGKIREGMESIPLDLNQHVGNGVDHLGLSAKASLSRKLHHNVLTPDTIPEFCLPPRLYKRDPLLATERTQDCHQNEMHRDHASSSTIDVKFKDVDTVTTESQMARKKPLPFSAEGYGLAGMHESPNTLRKESLFHSTIPGYILDRSLPMKATKLLYERNLQKTTTTSHRFLPLFTFESLSDTGSTESDIPSSNDSSPPGSPQNSSSANSILLDSEEDNCQGMKRPPTTYVCTLKAARSCPLLYDTREEKGQRWKREASPLTCLPKSVSSSVSLAPPILFPLDVLHCQERLQQEHILLLPGRGRIRLSAERTAFTSSTFCPLSTVRIRVVSVEDLRDDGDQRPLNCALSLCLTPGKLQRQNSTTIRNCRSPVFNEDFFFTELSQENILVLDLRVKVVDKPRSATLRRGKVVGIITKPLAQLISVKSVEQLSTGQTNK